MASRNTGIPRFADSIYVGRGNVALISSDFSASIDFTRRALGAANAESSAPDIFMCKSRIDFPSCDTADVQHLVWKLDHSRRSAEGACSPAFCSPASYLCATAASDSWSYGTQPNLAYERYGASVVVFPPIGCSEKHLRIVDGQQRGFRRPSHPPPDRPGRGVSNAADRGRGDGEGGCAGGGGGIGG